MAAGLSAASAPLDRIRGRARVVAVNRSHELVPWADALYACDGGFWARYPGARAFPGLKFSHDEDACALVPDIIKVTLAKVAGRYVDTPVREPAGTIACGLNSGYQALNLVAQTGVRRIILVAYDMRGKHWHPDHGRGLGNPAADSLAKWAAHFDAAAPVYASWGIEVLNASPISAITAFPKVDLEEALACCV